MGNRTGAAPMSAEIILFPVFVPPGTTGARYRHQAGPITVVDAARRFAAAARIFTDTAAAQAARMGVPDLVGIGAEAEELANAALQRLADAEVKPRRRR